MKLIIDRQTWLRGEGSEDSFLLRGKDDKMCCLGFLACEVGVPREHMLHSEGPVQIQLDESRELMPEFLFFSENCTLNSSACDQLIEFNDDPELEADEREVLLKGIFAVHGIEVEFIN